MSLHGRVLFLGPARQPVDRVRQVDVVAQELQ